MNAIYNAYVRNESFVPSRKIQIITIMAKKSCCNVFVYLSVVFVGYSTVQPTSQIAGGLAARTRCTYKNIV